MFDANDFVRLINQAAIGAYNSLKPLEVLYGTVNSISPLHINVDQKTTFTEEQLVLTRNVTDYSLELTEASLGTRTYQVDNALKIGEKVILLRVQGGQEYLVLDRVV